MGEARQRRLARKAGRPWERDAPPAREPLPWYMDPMCPALPPRPERAASPEPQVVVLSSGSSEGLDHVRAELERRNMGRVLLVEPEEAETVERLRELAEPPGRMVPPPGRRPRTAEILMLLAALGMDAPGASIVTPGGRGRR